MKITDEEIQKDLEVCQRVVPGQMGVGTYCEKEIVSFFVYLSSIEKIRASLVPVFSKLFEENEASFFAAARTRWPLYIKELKELREENWILRAGLAAAEELGHNAVINAKGLEKELKELMEKFEKFKQEGDEDYRVIPTIHHENDKQIYISQCQQILDLKKELKELRGRLKDAETLAALEKIQRIREDIEK